MARQIYQAIVDGILVGGVYALMAVGLTLIFGVLDIINIAQGVLVILGAYLSYTLSVRIHLDLFLGLLITVPVMFVIGVVIQWAFIRRLRGRERTSMTLLVTYAVALIIEGILYEIYGPNPKQLNASYVQSSVHVFGFYLSYIYLYGFALALVLVAAIYALLYRTRFGRSVRATMQDETAARLIGIEREPRRRAHLRRRRRGDRGRRDDVRRHQRLQPQQRLRPDLAAARDRHPGRPRQHRRRAGRVGLHAHPGVAGRYLVPGMGHRGVLRRPGAGAGDPPDRVLRAAAGASAMTGPMMGSVSRQRAAAGLALVLLAVAAIVFPVVFSSPVITNYAIYALIFIAVVTAWNMFSGFSGYISLGQAVFFGSGAYAVGIAARDWHINGVGVFALLPLAAAVGAVIAVPFGLVALRVRRHTFIVITIAVFFIFQLMAFNFSFTGGSVGVSAPFLPWSPTTFNDRFYYITLGCAVVAVVLAVLVKRARFGLQLRAIRDDEDRARGLGVRTMRVKLAAFVLSATITGLVGGVWFLYLTQVQPPSGFDPLFDLSLVLMAFLGGLGTISGPIIGALIIEPGQLYLTIRYTNGYLSEILLGALFLAIVIFVPRGIVPTAGEWMRRLRTRGRPAVPPVPAAPDPDPARSGLSGGTR